MLMVGSQGFSLESIAPVLGCVLGNIMWFSPLPAVLAARRNKFLGALNPYPFGECCSSTESGEAPQALTC
jgi:hypothetical protein